MNQTAIDMLQPGDVLVVDIFGKKVDGTIVGDNLFYYVMKATNGGGLVVDGSIRDLNGISEIDMPAYFKSADPTPIGNVMLTGINVPIRIGNVTVMPGDLVVGDREGVYFVPLQFLREVLDRADEIRIHDEWTKKKFDEGKYVSSDIYGRPRDPALVQEYEAYLKEKRQDDYLDNLCRKLFSYALGRSLIPSDDKAIAAMKAKLKADGHAFGSLVKAIVASELCSAWRSLASSNFSRGATWNVPDGSRMTTRSRCLNDCTRKKRSIAAPTRISPATINQNHASRSRSRTRA